MYPFTEPQYQYCMMFSLALILLRLPKIGKFFRIINTLYHENGHALVSLITGGSMHRIDLFADTSGACVTSSKTWISRFLTVLAGYPAAAAASYGMFYLLLRNEVQLLLYIVSAIALFNLFFWVRNKYGVIWLVLFLLCCGALIYFNPPYVTFYFLFFLASLNLVEAFWSCLYLIYLSLENPHHAGDAYSLREMTLLPAFIWALVFLVFCMWMLVLCVKILWYFDFTYYLF